MLRLTPEAYADLQQRMRTAADGRRPITRAPAAPVKRASDKGRNKFGAEATTIGEQRFDSKAEARRYLQLQTLERAGEITDLRTQVAFELIPAQDIDGRKEKSVRYIADFQYQTKTGETVVEDVKSAPTKTREFILKRKLMLHVHGIAVREVLMDD